MDSAVYRLLFYLAVSGVFFYRSYPKPEWKWYVGLPLYWLYVLFFYFAFAGMMSAGLLDVFKDRLVQHAGVESQITIISAAFKRRRLPFPLGERRAFIPCRPDAGSPARLSLSCSCHQMYA